MESLGCIANSQLMLKADLDQPQSLELGITNPSENQIVKNICPQNSSWCLGTAVNTTLGRYGTFSVCNSTERGSWILDQYYKSKNNDTSFCSSNGGIIKNSTLSSSNSTAQAKICRTLLQQAGPEGTGIITFTPKADSYSDEQSHRLSVPGEIGLAVGTVLLVILSTIATLVLLLKRKRKRKPPATTASENEFTKAELPDNTAASISDGKPGIHGSGRKENDGHERQEIDGSERQEIDGWERQEIYGWERQEIDGTEKMGVTRIFELPAEVPISELEDGIGKTKKKIKNKMESDESKRT